MLKHLNSSKTTKKNYREHVSFAEIKRRTNVVSFQDLASYLVYEKWYTERNTNTANEPKRITQTAAKIILNDIRSRNYETDYYPTTAAIEKASKKVKTIFPKL